MGARRIWTAEEDLRMLDLKARGFSYTAIASHLSSSKGSVADRIARLRGVPAQVMRAQSELPPPATHPSKPGARRCLAADCGKLFASPHAGVRICPACKARHAYQTANFFTPC